MRRSFIPQIIFVSLLSFAAVSPALAAKAKPTAKLAGACGQPNGRCVSDCDASNWCTVYTCTNGQSTAVPFWRCFQPSGLCLAPHC